MRFILFQTDLFPVRFAYGWMIVGILILSFLTFPSSIFGQNENWLLFNTSNSSLPDNNVLSLAMDSKGNKWIGTKYGGLVKFNGASWEIYLPDSTILSPPPLQKCYLNFAVPDKISKTAIRFENVIASGPQFNAFYDLAIDANENKWIGSKIGGLIRFDGVNWTVYNKKNSKIPDNYAWSVAIDRDGNKWIGTKQGGLAKFDGSNWTIYNTSNSELPDNDVCSLMIDKGGIKWIGTLNGLAKFDGKKWTIYRKENSGLPVNAIWALAPDNRGNVWIGTYGGGLVKFNGANWMVFNDSNSGLPGNEIRSIAVENATNTTWIGTTNAGLAKFDGFSWAVYDTLNSGLPHNCIWDILIDADGNKWIGTSLGLAIYREGEVVLPENGEDFTLSQNYPNPFNANTEFSFSISRQTRVIITIFNVLGHSIRMLTDNEHQSGTYFVKWDGLTAAGNPAPAGLYLYQLKTEFGTRTKKMMLIR